ncbi:hypothetical protein AB3S75_039028 [Citrus x aurantiifolia]
MAQRRRRNARVAEPPVRERDLGDIERDDLRRQVEQLQQRLQHLEGTRKAAFNGSSEEEGSINDGVDYNPFHQEISNSEFSSRSRIHRRRNSYQPFDFKVEIPEFEGRMQPEEFVDWLNTVERIFEYRDVPEDRKVKLIAIKLKKYASLWWENLKRQRKREGRRKIVTWEKMKKELKRKFLPDNYRQDIYLKFHNFRQKELSVEDYTAEFDNLMMKCDLVEAEERSKSIKKMHEQVRDRILKQNEKYKKSADKYRRHAKFQEGDLVWVHLRKDHFPPGKFAKLRPRADGPFKVLQRIGDNAYKIELPDGYGVSSMFNISDLSPYHEENDQNSRSNFFQLGEINTGVFEIFGNQVIPSAGQVLTLIK